MAGVAGAAGAAEAEMATMCKVAPSATPADARVAASSESTRPEQMTRSVSDAEPVAASILVFSSATVIESLVVKGAHKMPGSDSTHDVSLVSQTFSGKYRRNEENE